MEIILTNGKVALVDPEDYAQLSQYKWRAWKNPRRNVWYAIRSIYFAAHPGQPWKNDTIRMHCQILRYFGGIDHVNHDGLDNRKSNLRPATITQNLQNARKRKGTSSQYKGVYWDTQTNKWKARIHVDKKRLHLGYYIEETDAARAYDEAAKKYFKEFASTNL